MLKQKIAPQFSKFDIINSEMPEVFLDPSASTKIFLYRTDQEFENMFIDEDAKEQRIVNFSLDQEVEIWLGQNLSKQINPYQGASAAKTMAMATEIELYTFLDLRGKIDKNLYFFTFNQITGKESIKNEPKYLIKEVTPNLDKGKFRFARIKAWQLSSTLIKNYQYWFFNKSAGIGRVKVKNIKIELESTVALGGIKINGSNVLGIQPQELNYRVDNIVHPFESLEPIALNFSYQNGSIYTQLVHWDYLGRAIKELQNHYFVLEGGTNKYNTKDWSKTSIGLWNELAGAIVNDAPTGAQIGLGEMYCSTLGAKEATADLKAYIWGKETWGWGVQREYWNLKKCCPVNDHEKIARFIKESTPTFNFDCYWSGYDDDTYGSQFQSCSYKTMTQESFEFSNELVSSLKEAKQYCWALMGRMDFMNPGPFKKRFDGRSSWTNNNYYTWSVLPMGFNKVDMIKTIWNNIRVNQNMDTISIYISFDNPVYLSSIEIDSLFSDTVVTTITSVNNIVETYDNYTSFYLLGQDSIHTKLSFL